MRINFDTDDFDVVTAVTGPIVVRCRHCHAVDRLTSMDLMDLILSAESHTEVCREMGGDPNASLSAYERNENMA